MSRPKGSKNKTRICKYGHDVSCGKNSWGQCSTCYFERHPNQKPGVKTGNTPWNKNKKFCDRGHDKDIVGRDSQGHCVICQRAHQMKCQTNRHLRIVEWTDWDNIFNFEANKPKSMTTDHYIPLQGKNVSGLHVSWNLRYLNKSSNSSKRNNVDLLEASFWYGTILEKVGLK